MQKLQTIIDWVVQVKDFALENPLILIVIAALGFVIWLVDLVGAFQSIANWFESLWAKPPFKLMVSITRQDMISLADKTGQVVGDVDYRCELRIQNISESRRIIREVQINKRSISSGVCLEPMAEFWLELKSQDVVAGLETLRVKTAGRTLRLREKEAQELIQRKLAVVDAEKKFKMAMVRRAGSTSDLMLEIVREIGYYEKATSLF